MALTVSLNGSNFSIPEPGESGYDLALTQYLKALATAFPQLGVAATQALTQELDLGATFGVKAAWFKSQTANPAQSGQVRLAKTDALKFRNNANNADLALGIDAGDALTFGGANVTGNPMAVANSTAAQIIVAGATSIVVFGSTVETDSDNAYNSGSGRFTVPVGKGGDYAIAAQVQQNATQAGAISLAVFKTAASAKLLAALSAQTAGVMLGGEVTLRLAAGDVIDVRLTNNGAGSQTLSALATANWISIKRIPT